MKTFARIVVAMLGFAALAMGARTQEPDQLTIRIPYEFVASGKTLPAGTYRLNRTQTSPEQHQLVLRNVERAAGVLVTPSEVEVAGAGKPAFTFQEIGGRHFLTQIHTAQYVFAVPVSKSVILEAANKSHQAPNGLELGN
jgi:hypothetical protein